MSKISCQIISISAASAIDQFCSLDSWTLSHIDKLNSDLFRLRNSDVLQFDREVANFRRSVFDCPYENALLIIAQGPSSTYKSFLDRYLSDLALLQKINGVFQNFEVKDRDFEIKELIYRTEEGIIRQLRDKFVQDFNTIYSAALLGKWVQGCKWKEIASLRLVGPVVQWQALTSNVFHSSDKFPIIGKLLAVQPFMESNLGDLVQLFQDADLFIGDHKLNYFNEFSSLYFDTVLECQELVSRMISCYQAISKVEVALSILSSCADVSFDRSDKSRLSTLSERIHGKNQQQGISKLVENMRLLRSVNNIIHAEYQKKLQLIFIVEPMNEIQKLTTVTTVIDGTYKSLMTVQLGLLVTAEELPEVCFANECKMPISSVKKRVSQFERGVINERCKEFQSHYDKLIGDFRCAVPAIVTSEKWCYLDLKRGSILQKLDNINSLFSISHLKEFLVAMEVEAANSNYVRDDATAISVLLSDFRKNVETELLVAKAGKSIDFCISNLAFLSKESKYSQVMSDLTVLFTYDDKAYKIMWDKVYQGLVAKVCKNIDLLVLNRGLDYKDDLTHYLGVLRNVEKYIFSNLDLKSMIQDKLKMITNREESEVTSMIGQFNESVSKPIQEFCGKIKALKKNQGLCRDGEWVQSSERLRNAIDNAVQSGEKQIKLINDNWYNPSCKERMQLIVDKSRSMFAKANQSFNEQKAISDLTIQFDDIRLVIACAILSHVEAKDILFQFIDCKRLSQTVLIERFGVEPAVFVAYTNLFVTVNFVSEYSMGNFLNQLFVKFLDDLHVELIVKMNSKICSALQDDEHHKFLPVVLNFLKKRANNSTYESEKSKLAAALDTFQASKLQSLKDDTVVLSTVVAVFEKLNCLQLLIRNHMIFSMTSFQESLVNALQDLKVQSDKEICDGIKASGAHVSDISLQALRKYISVKNEILNKELFVVQDDFFSNTLLFVRGLCGTIFDELAKRVTDLHLFTEDQRTEYVQRCGWIIVKLFSLQSELNLNKTEVVAFVESLMAKLNSLEFSEHIGRVVLTGKEHSSLGTAANEAINSIPRFRRLHIEMFNAKARGVSFRDAIRNMKTEFLTMDTSRKVYVSTSLDANYETLLRVAYQYLTDSFCTYLEKYIKKTYSEQELVMEIYSWVNEINQTEKRFIDRSTPWSYSHVQGQIGKLLGCVFALWSILDAQYDDFNQNNKVKTSTDVTLDTYLFKRPHATQVLSIMALLGINNEESFANHLAEVKTGEGKSVSLGMLSAVFALFGFEVSVVCYSKYLSERDHSDFKELFDVLGIQDQIHYCDIDHLMRREMRHAFPNLVNQIDSFLKNKRPDHQQQLKIKRLLLIDEVDVFFGENFYGRRVEPLNILDSAASRGLMEHLFSYRHEFFKLSLGSAKKLISERQCYVDLIAEYPNVECLLEKQLEVMLSDLESFKDTSYVDQCDRFDGLISYIDRNGNRNYHTHDGYKTGFTYLYYRSINVITNDTPGPHTKYGVRVACGSLLYSNLPNNYGNILGLTGSLSCLTEGDKKILNSYKIFRRTYIPSTFDKKTLEKETLDVCYEGGLKYFSNLNADIRRNFLSNRTQLVVFETNEDLQFFNKHHFKPISHADFRFPEVLNDSLNASERDNIITRATNWKSITFMTRAFGRGTDFLCANKEVLEWGGVLVILTFFPETEAEEVQIMGRTCRQDNDGRFKMVLSSEDLKKKELATDSEIKSKSISEVSLREKRKDLNKVRHKKMIENLGNVTTQSLITTEMVSLMNSSDALTNPDKVEKISKMLIGLQDSESKVKKSWFPFS